jgi:UDP-N-acetylmuramate--alanine ligase
MARFHAFHKGEALGEFSVRMPGQHNVLNTLAAIAVADELEVPLDVMKTALANFDGVARRFTIVGEADGVTLVDDYGHHPAEVQATLAAARHAFSKRVIVAFQPHRYTRTELLFEDFARAFNEADFVFVSDIYAAGETPISGVSAEKLAESMRRHGHRRAEYVADRGRLVERLIEVAKPGDAVIALGAGDINKVLKPVMSALAERGKGS